MEAGRGPAADPEDFVAKAVHICTSLRGVARTVCAWLCGAVEEGESGGGRKVVAGLTLGPGKKGRRRKNALDVNPRATQTARLSRSVQFASQLSRRIHPQFQWVFYLAF